MTVHHTSTPKPAQTGKLALPPKPAAAPAHAPAAHAPAPKPQPKEPSRSEALKRLHDVVDAKDANMPWRNNADMNAKLSRKIMDKIKAGHVTSAAGVNAIVHGIVGANRSKLSYWNYDFHIDNKGKVDLKLMFKGKMDSFDSSGVTLRQSVDAFIKKGGDPNLALTILKQVDDPDHRIKQVTKFTCVPANVQRQIAKLNPQKYFVLASELVTKGHAKLPNGGELTVNAENRKWIESQMMPGNKKVNAYFQASLMEKANGKAKYNMKDDKSEGNGVNFEALGIEQAQSLWKDMGTGTPTFNPVAFKDLQKAHHKPATASGMMHEVERLFNAGKGEKRVAVPLTTPDKHVFHQVTITDISHGKVKYYDPAQEKIVSVSRDQFMRRLGVNMQKSDRIGENSSGTAMAAPAPAPTAPPPIRRR